MSIQITESEILDALNDALKGVSPPDARTSEEIRQETGISDKKLRMALRSIQLEGRLCVHVVMRRDIAGRPIKVPAYTISPRPRKAKK